MITCQIPSWLTFFSSKIPRLLKFEENVKSKYLMLRILSHRRIFEFRTVRILSDLRLPPYEVDEILVPTNSKLKKFSRLIWKHKCIGSQQEIFRMSTSMVTFEIKSVLGVLFSVQQKSKFETNTSTLA